MILKKSCHMVQNAKCIIFSWKLGKLHVAMSDHYQMRHNRLYNNNYMHIEKKSDIQWNKIGAQIN